MGSKLKLFRTSGTVELDGSYVGSAGKDLDQELPVNDTAVDKNIHRVKVHNNSECEFHYKRGGSPHAGDANSLCFKVHAKGGVFDLVKVRSRPKRRKSNGNPGKPPKEVEASMDNYKRIVRVTARQNGKPAELTYTVWKKGLAGYGPKLQLTIHL